MFKQEFINALAKKHRRPQRHYQEALDEILGEVKDLLKQGKSLHLTGFGTFYTRTHKGGRGVNLRTKQPVTYPSFKQAAFRVGKLLRQVVRGRK